MGQGVACVCNRMRRTVPSTARSILRDQIGLEQLGLRTNQVWHDDPQGLRLRARALSLRRQDAGAVGRTWREVGCSDGFGARIVLQETGPRDRIRQRPHRHRGYPPAPQRRIGRSTTDVHDILDRAVAARSRRHLQPRRDPARAAGAARMPSSITCRIRSAGTTTCVIVGTPTPESRSNVAIPASVNLVRARSCAECRPTIG